MPIEVETRPSNGSIPESAFYVSGGKLEVSDESVVFVAQSPGSYEVFVKYEGVKSNTLIINYEDKEAIAQEEAEALAKAKAEEEAKAKAEEEAKAKAEAEAKAKKEEEEAAKAEAAADRGLMHVRNAIEKYERLAYQRITFGALILILLQSDFIYFKRGLFLL